MRHLPKYLSLEDQKQLLDGVRDITRDAPLFIPTMPRWGTAFSVRMTNCGDYGWVSDKSGYRYQSFHPDTKKPWPKIPKQLLDIWHDLVGAQWTAEACLINYYAPSAKMGLHQDNDEANFDAPVLSISLGDDCIFRLGGLKRSDPTQSFTLNSGDIILLEKESRLKFHGVDRIKPNTSTLLSAPGRLNLTMRVVN